MGGAWHVGVRRLSRRGKGQPSSSIQQIALLGAERAPETIGVDDLLALGGWHAAQIADCILHHAASFRGEVPHLRIKSPRLLLLLRSQVLPDFHAVQHPLLLLGGQVAEVLQAILEPLLMLGG